MKKINTLFKGFELDVMLIFDLLDFVFIVVYLCNKFLLFVGSAMMILNI